MVVSRFDIGRGRYFTLQWGTCVVNDLLDGKEGKVHCIV